LPQQGAFRGGPVADVGAAAEALADGVATDALETISCLLGTCTASEAAVELALRKPLSRIKLLIQVADLLVNGPDILAINPADLKPLSRGEIKQLQEAGFDPHDLKPKNQGSRWDLFKDRKGGIWTMLKSGRGEPEFTGLNINNL
jgi:hypothetical protein